MKHVNIALFVPDEGCPHQCSFCNQKTISGKLTRLTVADIDTAVSNAFKSDADLSGAEIAFFGGSFTGIEREYMLELLSAAKKYVDGGAFKGIRISTRPDYIDKDILEILKEFGVTTIELGCQSMDDAVLSANRRGHTREDVIESATLIKEYGFEFGVQMMTGLYTDSAEKSLMTAESLIALSPNTARIYPTVVLENTELCRLYKEGKYSPQGLDDAVELCSKLLKMFHDADIPVIRLGLHSGGNVDEGYVTGPYHPAFRELCEGRIYYGILLDEISKFGIDSGDIEISVGSKYVSMLTGQKKCNIKALEKRGFRCRIIQREDLEKYKVIVRG